MTICKSWCGEPAGSGVERGGAAPIGGARALVVRQWMLHTDERSSSRPRRFNDLPASLPGISANALSGGLAGMAELGIVRQRHLCPASTVHVYQLTESGRALVKVVEVVRCWSELGSADEVAR